MFHIRRHAAAPARIADAGDFEYLDRQADKWGRRYRGAGILIGYLGIAVIFCAIAPVALQIEDAHTLQTMGALKVAMMIATLVLILRVSGPNGAKQRWIAARRAAEALRYRPLQRLLLEFEATLKHGAVDGAAVRQQLHERIRIDLEQQVAYNRKKHHDCELIEQGAKRLSWLVFFVALGCAIGLLLSELELIGHHPWLILGTAFLPALLGGIHGINAFLDISGLAEQHERMAGTLDTILKRVSSATLTDAQLIAEARSAWLMLSERDSEWADKSSASELIPG
ncbi:hypothetical protein LJ656_24935 [Paraburkholderia sp. MMS20-SJTR3]|uniref:SMODS and SLOG-associating 2TM effector domain-containing protein n=1 Tax=Paraburkholderia sejongensis TaxID=2886946 RepID=A0ABS8K1D9_9BURK|nr:hypothetical protein [Paraburkholderia sp. MMS20-SJTR3]MCC8395835.1 hypothetical protein [Paraburkholderia sp. MMS20-SJTR3]